MKIKLTLEEKAEINYAIWRTEEFYKIQLKNMLDIQERENVEKNIEYWAEQIEKIRKLKAKLEEMRKRGEL